MNYVILYFVLGAIVNAGIVLMNKKAGNWHGWGTIGFVFLVFPLWPVYAIPAMYGMLMSRPRKCGFCGHYSHNDDELKAHIMACDLHPMRQEMEQVQSRLDVVIFDYNSLRMVCRDLLYYRDHNEQRIEIGVLDHYLNRMREHEAANE